MCAGRDRGQARQKGIAAIIGDIEHEEAGRTGGNAAVDLPGQIAFDGGQRGKQRQPQPQRHHQIAGGRAGPVQIGQRQPGQCAARARQSRRAPGDGAGQQPQHQQQAQCAANKADHEDALLREADQQGQHGRRHRRDDGDGAGIGPGAGFGQAAQQAGGGHARALRQRPQRKGQCNRQAVKGRLPQRRPLQPGRWRHWQAGSGEARDQRRRGCADGQADQHGANGHQRQLPEIDGAHRGAVGAQGFQRGDGAGARRQIGRNAAGNANPGHHQRRKADQGEKLAQLIDEIAGARRAVAAVADAGAFGHGFQARPGSRGGHARLQADAQFAGVEAAQRDQASFGEIGAVDDQPGAKAEAVAGAVRLFDEGASKDQPGLAERQHIAGLQAELVGQRRLRGGIAGPHTAAACQNGAPIERPAGIDGLDFGEHGIAAILARHHSAQFDHFANAAQFGRHRALCIIRGRARQAQRDIAAEQQLPALGEASIDGAGQAADAGQRRHPKHQAHGKNAQAGQAAAQFPQCEA